MNDKIIDDLFDDAIPDPDLNAKKIAINTAVSLFSEETLSQKAIQGNRTSARPIDNEGTLLSKKSIWSELMNFLKNPNSGRVFATVAVGFVAFAIVNQMPEQHSMISNSERAEPEFNPEVIDTIKADVAQESELGSQPESKLTALEPQRLDETIVVSAEKRAVMSQDTPITIQAFSDSDASSAVEYAPASELDRAPVRMSAKIKQVAAAKPKSDSFSKRSRPQNFEDQLSQTSQRPDLNEEYVPHTENPLKLVEEEPVSTFSADVDTASYSLLRNQLQRGFLPAPTAVRSEEVINYFSYDYPLPESKSEPFRANISVLDSPWNESKKLVHIGIKGYDIQSDKKPDSNLVFLLDVSGSMSAPNKLPLVKQSIALLLNKLKPSDTVSIVVYAGAAGVVLEPTKAKNKATVLAALQRLSAGGSTAGGAGIELAYQLAEQNFNADAVNRIILATDGDFNVGQHSNEALKALVERKRDSGVFLSILGFGRNNYQDDMMQTLAQNGNGVAAYIDSLSEAKKVLVDQSNATLFTIAKDVKFQVEFNPQTVSDYRLVGYETRHLNREDFNNDKVDAGDIGSGHTVTAIYEITPSGTNKSAIDPLRYGTNSKKVASINKANEYGFLKMRYKLANQSVSKLVEHTIPVAQSDSNQDVNFSIAAASFAQYLKGGKYLGELSLTGIAKMARASKGKDDYGYRSEFIQLVELAQVAKP